MKNEEPVEEDDAADDAGAFSEEELASFFSEDELDNFAEEELAVDLADDELTAFADEELAAVLVDELDVAATEDELEFFFTLEEDFRKSDGTECSFPYSSSNTYVTLLELSEHAINARASDVTAASFKREKFLNKVFFIISLIFILS